MSDSEEDLYSVLFSSLKHPARRKILRMLPYESADFSQMLRALGFSNSQLYYHLEGLNKLVSKTIDGVYHLSKYGEASVEMMKAMEETSAGGSKGITICRKSAFALFLVAIVVLAGLLVFQNILLVDQLSSENELLRYENDLLADRYQQLLTLSADTDKAINFIQDVIQIDLDQYQVTLLSATVEFRSDLGGIAEEIFRYSLSNSLDEIEVVLRFRDNHLSKYQIYLFEGSIIYSEPQSFDLLHVASDLLDRYKLFADALYLEGMKDLLDLVDEAKNVEIYGDNINMKLKISTSLERTEFMWLYTESGIEFSPKRVSFVFENKTLSEITDGWFLFETTRAEINIGSEEAISIAREAVEVFTWEFKGETVSNFTILEVPVDVEFVPHPRDDFVVLVPYWFVTLYLDDVYPGDVNRIAVGLWADTGEIADIKAVIV